jgi:multiple sugar transport system substrate-binding protein
MQWNGYAGDLGYASAGVLADWVVVDMFASVASGKMTPKQAVSEAEKRARRFYNV